ncbi:MAG: hypothetical protein GY941_23615 [Planctomycetes bacterium]|nr:hypothetical protein [Planctomycetota bacterium]
MKDIYKMKFHDEIEFETGAFGETVILRVPGGWIYDFTKFGGGEDNYTVSRSTTFVPFSNEFNETITNENDIARSSTFNNSRDIKHNW